MIKIKHLSGGFMEEKEAAWVNCEDCKHHYWKHGHMWTCNQEKAGCTIDLKSGLVQCVYFVKKEEETK
jgi:hypothetical protein